MKTRRWGSLDTFTLLILLIELSQVSYWPHAVNEFGQEDLFLNKVISYVVILITTGYILLHSRRLSAFLTKRAFFVVTGIFVTCVMMSFFSDYQFTSIRIVTKIFILAIVVLIMVDRDRDRFTNILAGYAVVFGLVNLAAVILVPAHAVETGWLSRAGDWRGLLPFRIAFGVNSSIFLILLLALLMKGGARNRALLGLGAIVLAVCVYGSQSRIAWGGAIAGCAFVMLGSGLVRIRRRDRKSIAITLALLIPFGIFLVSGPLAESLLGAVGRDLTFSGRTALWNHFWSEIMSRPITGFGAGAFFQDQSYLARFYEQMGWGGFMTAHNSYVEWGLSAGIPGLILFSLLMLGYYGRLVSLAGKDETAAGLAAVGWGPIVSLSTVFLSEGGVSGMVLFVVFYTLCLNPVSQRSPRTRSAAALEPFNPVTLRGASHTTPREGTF